MSERRLGTQSSTGIHPAQRSQCMSSLVARLYIGCTLVIVLHYGIERVHSIMSTVDILGYKGRFWSNYPCYIEQKGSWSETETVTKYNVRHMFRPP